MQEIGAQIEARDDVTRVEFTSADEAWEFYKENFIPRNIRTVFPEGTIRLKIQPAMRFLWRIFPSSRSWWPIWSPFPEYGR